MLKANWRRGFRRIGAISFAAYQAAVAARFVGAAYELHRNRAVDYATNMDDPADWVTILPDGLDSYPAILQSWAAWAIIPSLVVLGAWFVLAWFARGFRIV